MGAAYLPVISGNNCKKRSYNGCNELIFFHFCSLSSSKFIKTLNFFIKSDSYNSLLHYLSNDETN